MMAMIANLIVWGGVAATLVAVILYDLRQMRIPNGLSLGLVALFAVMLVLGGLPGDLLARLGLAAVVFVIGFASFILRVLGGGDVKILSALALFVPLDRLAEILLVFSLTLIVSTLAVLLSRQVAANPESDWAVLRRKKMPMGLAIGAAGLVSLWLFGVTV